jgi:hypothetical protein
MKVTQSLWALRLFKLSRNNRLPRGSKRAQISVEGPPEFKIQPGEIKPYDLSKLNPLGTITFGQPPRPQVTAESLARFMVMENVKPLDPQRVMELLGSVETATNKPE